MPSPPPPKYIFQNGVMKLNPEYTKSSSSQNGVYCKTTVAEPTKALAIVSSTDDVATATLLQKKECGREMQLSDATASSIQIMQDPDFLQKFKTATPIDGGELLDSLSTFFAKYEIPIGLVNNLLYLTEYKLHFIIDDSGSMSSPSDYPRSTATYLGTRNPGKKYLTRWEEAEERLHVMFDILSHIPTEEITVSFLNKPNAIVFRHDGKQPAAFAADAHTRISAAFAAGVQGGTPIYGALSHVFASVKTPTMVYLFTDGCPSDRSCDEVANLVLHRKNPERCPLTFISCTDCDHETEWMKTIEEKAPYTAELDDFDDERTEVLHDQGPAFPFSRGMWLICQLIAAVCPHDLDALDESMPFTKQTLDNLLGRVTLPNEYEHYFQNHPQRSRFQHLYSQFQREDVKAMDIPGVAALRT